MAEEFCQPFCGDRFGFYHTPRNVKNVSMNPKFLDTSPFDFSIPLQRTQKRAIIPPPPPGPNFSLSSPTLSFFNTGAIGGFKLVASPPLSKNSTFGFFTAQSPDNFFDQRSNIDAGAASLNRVLFPEAFDSRFTRRGGYASTEKGIAVGGLGAPMDETPGKRSLGSGLVRNILFGSEGNDQIGTLAESSIEKLIESINEVSIIPPRPEYVVINAQSGFKSPSGREYVYVLIAGDEIQFLPSLIAQGVNGGMAAEEKLMGTVDRILRSAHEIRENGYGNENLEIRLRYTMDWDSIRPDHQTIMDAFLVGFTHAFEIDNIHRHRYDIMKISSAKTGAYLRSSLQEHVKDPDCIGIIAAGSYWLPYEETIESVMTFLKTDDQLKVERSRFLYLVQDNPCAAGVVKDCKTGKTLFYKKHWSNIFRTQTRQIGPPSHLFRPFQMKLDPVALRIISEELKQLNPSPCYDHYIRKDCKSCRYEKCRFSNEFLLDDTQLFALWSLYAKCSCTAGANCRDMGCPKKHC